MGISFFFASQDNVRVYLAMIELAMQSGDQALAEETFDLALQAPEVPQTRKLEMLQRKYEYFEEMTFDVTKAQSALEEYTKMLKVSVGSSDSTKNEHRNENRKTTSLKYSPNPFRSFFMRRIMTIVFFSFCRRSSKRNATRRGLPKRTVAVRTQNAGQKAILQRQQLLQPQLLAITAPGPTAP